MRSDEAKQCRRLQCFRRDGQEVLALEGDIIAELESAGPVVAAGLVAIEAAACVHRVGVLAIGEMAVWVGVSAAHRGPAFEACRWIIDEIKARVPIWKNERYADGEGAWLHPQPPA